MISILFEQVCTHIINSVPFFTATEENKIYIDKQMMRIAKTTWKIKTLLEGLITFISSYTAKTIGVKPSCHWNKNMHWPLE